MPEHKSGDEIERVFKVRQIPKNIEKYPAENIVQGYLAIDAHRGGGAVAKLASTISKRLKGAAVCNAENWKSN